ncbi:DUF1697 domain-containing protein [Mycobacterium sp. CBMA271]|uniref:DUF1697 domain-containing protein n=1 Tax=unclassified Mycobacteroides TaxID=2618759 RepID=UPI0012DE91F8|nr:MULTISPECIES: DUF1697 domain-containing protein [unclassified Mycobacteroides]MUM16656.1 pyridoxamine 5-phosphate oxidase [Mycobacteroides sp. CBMA 326]MUM22034.1 DUF1697 domain-containing protein [Mycobacteroides sp. CBMA 271]
MTRYAALLRGVNVGGITMKMSDVRDALEADGFTGVTTVLASGNVLLDSTESAATVKSRLQQVLGDRFGYEAWVLMYDLDTIREIIAAFPWEPEVEGVHSYVMFCSDPAVLAELAALGGELDETERIAAGDGVLYWQVPRSQTLGSPVGKTTGKKRYKSSTTTRNLRTLHKLVC